MGSNIKVTKLCFIFTLLLLTHSKTCVCRPVLATRYEGVDSEDRILPLRCSDQSLVSTSRSLQESLQPPILQIPEIFQNSVVLSYDGQTILELLVTGVIGNDYKPIVSVKPTNLPFYSLWCMDVGRRVDEGTFIRQNSRETLQRDYGPYIDIVSGRSNITSHFKDYTASRYVPSKSIRTTIHIGTVIFSTSLLRLSYLLLLFLICTLPKKVRVSHYDEMGICLLPLTQLVSSW